MSPLDALRQQIPDVAKDIRLNLQTVLGDGAGLTSSQRWGVAVASSIASRNAALRDAVIAEATGRIESAVIDDARAAAAIMSMNNVFYRFRHMIGKAAYGDRLARLRMQRLAQPAASRTDLELFSLAVSAIHGCESCIRGHEKAVLGGGLGEEHVHEAVRIAATIHAAAVALELG